MTLAGDMDGGGASGPHRPVLLGGVLDALGPLAEKTVIDGTFGAGGYTRAFLEQGAHVIALDRDPNVAVHVETIRTAFGSRFTFHQCRFSEMDRFSGQAIDAIVLDIGVSSMQLDEAERGFSFMRDGPLDMRMAQSGLSAADIVNEFDEADLASILFVYGEERQSRRIAKAIVDARANGALTSTAQLATLIEKTIGRKPGGAHPATRSFQALRIAVNGEFEELVAALFAAEQVLAEGGILAVVTFHSLEDRIVKRFFSEQMDSGHRSRHLPQRDARVATWSPVAKAVKPSSHEISANPRARSAILRSAVRTSAPAREADIAGLGVPQVKLRGAA